MKHIYLLLGTLLSFTSLTYAQPGSLDQTFGDGGKVVTNLNKQYEQINALGLQSDGKIVAVASTFDLTSYSSFKVLRYYSNGSIDSLFGVSGIAKSPFDGNDNEGDDIIIQKDQKIIVAAAVSQSANGFGIIRYLKDGNIDSTFGENGKSFLQIPVSGIVRIKQLKNGKFILAAHGYSMSGPEEYFRLTRINNNGSLDTTFGSKGFVSTVLPYTYTSFNALSIDENGNMILGGYVTNSVLSDFDYLLVRYKSSGKIDSSFGVNGYVRDDFSSNSSFVANIIAQPNNKTMVTGTEASGGNSFFALALYNANGKPDSSFGINGKIISKNFSDMPADCLTSTLDSSGKIVLGGSFYDGIANDFGLVRYNINGSIDSSFGDNGRVISDFDNDYDLIIALIIQKDGKIVAGGRATFNGAQNIALARYNNDNILPITLSSFTATKKQTSVLLNWQTANETNNNYFAIERSNNSGNGFKEIARVNSKGNSSQTQQYSFEDITPLNGLNYYRLKQVNKDGSSSNSKIVLIDFTKDAIIALYPNPVKDILNIKGLSGTTTLSVIDAGGKVLATTKTTNNTYNWNIRALPSGNYYLRIEANKKITTIKFIKQ